MKEFRKAATIKLRGNPSEALGRVLEEGHDLRDHLLQAVELREGRVALDDAVGKEAGKAGIVAGVNDLGLAYRGAARAAATASSRELTPRA